MEEFVYEVVGNLLPYIIAAVAIIFLMILAGIEERREEIRAFARKVTRRIGDGLIILVAMTIAYNDDRQKRHRASTETPRRSRATVRVPH